MHRYRQFILTISLLLISTGQSFAQDERRLEEGVELIVSTAEGICISVEKNGSLSALDLEGEASAGLTLLSKKLADLGIEGAGRLVEQEFSNVLQKDLAAELRDNRRCREQIFNVMFAQVFSSMPEVVLSESQQKTLEGRVRPHDINLLTGEEKTFALNVGDSIMLLDTSYMITVEKIKRGKVYVRWARMSGKIDSGVTLLGQGQVGHFFHCGIAPYSAINEGEKTVSFSMSCDPSQ